MGQIFLIEGGELHNLSEREFAAEDDFQSLLERYPELIPGEQIDPEVPRRWLLVQREVGVPDNEGAPNRWALDHLFLDQDGIPTLVEVKRRSDARLQRREVVAQMLDYAANARFWNPETLRREYEMRCKGENLDAVTHFTQQLNLDPASYESFWDEVGTHLRADDLRLIFVADAVLPELLRVVEFLSDQMRSVRVFALELCHFVGQTSDGKPLKTLVPRLVGNPTLPKKGEPRLATEWNEERFFDAIQGRCSRDIVAATKALYDWAKTNGLPVQWGAGKHDGAFSPHLRWEGKTYWLFSVWSSGSIEFLFQYLKQNPPFDNVEHRQTLLNRLNTVKGIDISPDRTSGRPNVKIEGFADSIQSLLNEFDWLIQHIKEDSSSSL